MRDQIKVNFDSLADARNALVSVIGKMPVPINDIIITESNLGLTAQKCKELIDAINKMEENFKSVVFNTMLVTDVITRDFKEAERILSDMMKSIGNAER